MFSDFHEAAGYNLGYSFVKNPPLLTRHCNCGVRGLQINRKIKKLMRRTIVNNLCVTSSCFV